MLKALAKLIQLALIIVRHFFHGAFARAFFTDPREKREFLVELLSQSCRNALKVLSIEVKITDQRGGDFDRSKPMLIASNHLSYIDVMMISAWRAAAFVTSVEVKETPFLGKVCEDGGSLFVERRSRHGVRRDLRQVADQLRYGISVAIFPEATSTDGSEVKPFKRGLLTAAKLSGVDILPLCINYTHFNGQPLDQRNRDSIFYYGEMSFLSHLMRLLRAQSIRAELKILNPVAAILTTEDDAAEIVYEQVRSGFVPVT